jgi:hypothetical protein
MGLNSKLIVSVQADLTTQLDLALASAPMTKVYTKILTAGIAAGMADKVFHDTRTLTASATENLDLNGGGLLDPLGAAFNIVKVKGIVVAASDANTNDVIVGAAAATPWSALLGATGTVTVRPGGLFAAFAGQADSVAYAVGVGATDLLKVANSAAGTSVTYDVIIVGTSA